MVIPILWGTIAPILWGMVTPILWGTEGSSIIAWLFVSSRRFVYDTMKCYWGLLIKD
jgi:hypothetical protein